MAREDFYDSLFGTVYSVYMNHPVLGRPIARTVWGGSAKRYYESMAALGEVTGNVTVVDCPCGAGPALRALPPGSSARYIAADLSPSMLRRARAKAEKLGLAHVEVIEADASALPLEPASADLFLSYWGIHVFDDPRSAVAEMARVLKPGGHLVGATFVNEPKGLRQRLLLRPHSGDFGPLCTEADLRGWLSETGLKLTESSRSGPMFFFEARSRGAE